MAVYTRLSAQDIQSICTLYGLGELRHHTEIAEGIENSNFLLITQKHASACEEKYILTIYEKRMNLHDIPFFLNLMNHLHHAGIPCPQPLVTTQGQNQFTIHGKTGVIATFLEGKSTTNPTPEHLYQLGKYTARLHLATTDFPMQRKNDLSLAGWHTILKHIKDQSHIIDPILPNIIAETLAMLQTSWPSNLPSGIIHADLFPDNVFFKNEELSGIIDFYFACYDSFAYELAIIINAWCFDNQTHFNPTSFDALIAGYESIRPLNYKERAAMPLLLQGAALRFLLTRSYDWIFHDPNALVTLKDPKEYLHKLSFFKDSSKTIERLLNK